MTSLIGVRGLAWLRTVHVEEASEPTWRRLKRVLLAMHAEAQAAEAAVTATAFAILTEATRVLATDLEGVGCAFASMWLY